MTESHEKTAMFRSAQFEEDRSVHEVLRHVYDALHEKGYNPVGQIVGYLMSGDPTFITSHKNARTLITAIERDIILEELITVYLQS
ncbi:MAG TPA: IreB family regulatory phosphoprotein [Firmicutes bacterium]|jgi:uncharacterized protein (UPF0297 family)|nr:MAG: hypothetical protein AA931_01225 [Peptococcaceae bacterium 1109]HHT73091.1 IreB family regulatory phosphoprotein [Bacillota bacterium]